MQTLQNKKVIAGLIINEGKILIAQRAKKDSLFGKWEFPGGKLEEGETEHQCLIRELNEELGIDATIGTYFMSSYFEHKGMPHEMRVYYVPSFAGAISLFEHLETQWVTPSDLINFDMPEPDKPIVDALINGI